MEKRESFVIYQDMLECLDFMTDEQGGKLIKMIRDYHSGKDVSCDDYAVSMAFKMIQSRFDRNAARYDRCVANGKKGGAPKGNQNAKKNEEPENQGGTGEYENNQETTKEQPKNNLNDNVHDNVHDNVLNIIVPNGTCPTEVGRASEELTLFNDKEDITLRYNKVIELWNSTCGGLGNIPKVKSLNEERNRKIRLRIKELGLNYMERLNELFTKISSSPFLKGQMGNWNATFDWVFENETNIQKIFDGNYDAKPVSGNAQENMSNKRYTNAKWNR